MCVNINISKIQSSKSRMKNIAQNILCMIFKSHVYQYIQLYVHQQNAKFMFYGGKNKTINSALSCSSPMLYSFRNYFILLSEETVSCMDLQVKSAPWPKLSLPALNTFASINRSTVDGFILSFYYAQFFSKLYFLKPS